MPSHRRSRTPSELLALLAVPVLLLGACGGSDGLSDDEQAFADAFAADLADAEDGFGLDPDEAQCIGDAIMTELGLGPFEDAGLAPEDLEGDEAPGELLGEGAVSDRQATAISDAWHECVDFPAVFAVQAGGDFELDAEGIECLEEELRSTDVLGQFLEVSFTSEDPDAGQDVFERIVGLVQGCSSISGSGGVLVDSIAASLAADGTLDAVQSRCVAQHVVDTIGVDRLLSITADGDFSTAPAEVQNEFAAAIIAAAEECDVPISELGD